MPRSYPQINWGRGRVLPYESLDAIVAKLSMLNQISPRIAVKLLHDYCALDGSNEWNLRLNFKKMAKLLDEPIGFVRTVFLVDSIPIPEYKKQKRAYNYIQYCPQCIKRGFHSGFHLLTGLAKCPFDETPLDYSFSCEKAGTKYERYVRTLASILEEAEKKWLVIDEQRASMIDCDRLAPILKWADTTSGILGEEHNKKIWTSDENRFSHNPDMNLLLGRLNEKNKIPRQLLNILRGEIRELQFKTVSFGNETAKFMDEINENGIPLRELIWFYKRTGSLTEKEYGYKTCLARISTELKAGHEKCHCSWGWSKYGGWRRMHPHDWPHYGYICPFDRAELELQEGWGSYFKVAGPRDFETQWHAYMYWAQKLFEIGFVRLIDDSRVSNYGRIYYYPAGEPCVQWNDNFAGNDLIEAILTYEILGHKACILDWLKHIQDGGAPTDRLDHPAYATLFRSDDGLVLEGTEIYG